MGTREIVVLHHTDCGAQTFENGPFQEYLKEELGVDVSDQDFLPFQDIGGKGVREDYATPYRFSPNTRRCHYLWCHLRCGYRKYDSRRIVKNSFRKKVYEEKQYFIYFYLIAMYWFAV